MKMLLSMAVLSLVMQAQAFDMGKMKDKANKAKAEAQQKAESRKTAAEGMASNVLESCGRDLQMIEACRGVKEASKAQSCLASHADQLTGQCKSALGL